MYKYIVLLLLSFIPLIGEQTPWIRDTVQGFPVHKGHLETSEGFGAYMDFCLKPNTKNLDNGGGKDDFNTLFLKEYYGVTNVVFDPFMRSEEHNQSVLAHIEKHPFDTATSNSVLNVIDDKNSRMTHLKLSCAALKTGGIAYFKLYPGNGSSKGEYIEGGFQSIRPATTYQEEVEEVFGKGNVVVDISRELIIAYKNKGCSPQ